ncbi:hypothetical protein ACLB2K_054150 [Fragaria x ananassa]
MASMVATCFTLQPTLYPRLAFTTSLFPNPRPLNTFPHPISACFSAKLQESPRVSFPFFGGADFKGERYRSPFWRPRAFNDFVESIRSFMFGDGDPNKETNEERWKWIAQYITWKGGVVAAEELAPYLNPLETNGQNDIDDETFMLPVLTRYEGHPVIDEENGNVLYRFISLQPTPEELSDPNFDKNGKLLLRQKMFMEHKWRFSKTSNLEKAACVVSVTAIPSLRFVLFCVVFLKRNADIKKRNLARQRCARDLESPDLALRRKLETARDMAKRLTIVMTAGQEDVPVNVYGANRSTSTKSSRDLVEDI